MNEQIRILKPKKALNKAFLKVKSSRAEIENFKANLSQLLDRINESESEEFHKNLISDFLKDTYYKQNHFINTKGRNDLVIHNGQNANSTVGVIIEAKKPTNKSEMLTKENINAKAFQELVLYYLRERITHKNLEIKQLIVTNIHEWFIFDVNIFDRLFAQNKNLVNKFNDFENGRLADTKTDFFYKQIAEPFINNITPEIEFTYFDIRNYEEPLRNADKTDDNKLITLFKLLSPEHLLKLPFANDSNTLDKQFYIELLYIIGLTETKNAGKKLIERNKTDQRHTGTILEDTIIQLDSLDKLNRLENPEQFGKTQQERFFNVALELSITWINRILFLKLLEAQLIRYHKGDKSYSFLNLDKIKNYDDLNSLFFQVLARKPDERNEDVKKNFEKIPYLNSSLFEPTEIEQITLFISNLKDDKTIPIFSQTVLKDEQGKKRTDKINTLEYLFAFLDAYDFGTEGNEEIQEDNKTLINASVLGLIFEKINGYKDGSFFTPGFITMYMCRETIRKAVIQKFNETKKWNCKNIKDLYNKIEDRNEANKIINNLKICDPAVGSGHFLVSALNEIIAIKNDLKILQDRNARRLKEYHIEVINDELVVTDEDGELFEYNPTNKESQRIQETLFHEKQTIIENCLFGVDVNSNSVKICRLRLWIELLKNAYYKNINHDPITHGLNHGLNIKHGLRELETLPNIDINIKIGNSLISRFDIDADLKEALKKSASKWNILSYQLAVDTYRNAENKEQKREMQRLINEIKTNFRSEISKNDPKIKRLNTLQNELFTLTKQQQIFELSEKEKNEWHKKVDKLTTNIQKLETEIEEIKNNKIYENAFEWRFEFPEVLNNDGDFVGFDAVIGNPPYIQLQSRGGELADMFKTFNYKTFERTGDIYSLFYEKAMQLLKNNGILTFITSNKWMRAGYGKSTRKFFAEHNPIKLIDLGSGVFDSATVDTNILIIQKNKNANYCLAADLSKTKNLTSLYNLPYVKLENLSADSWTIANEIEQVIKQKIEARGVPLKDWDISIYRGILTGYNNAFIIDGAKKAELIAEDPKSQEIIKPILRGRDIKRYKADFADLWLINSHNGVRGVLPKIDVKKDYPAIYKHLKQFEPQLIKRQDKGEHWTNLRNCAYLQEFEKEKIVYPETTQGAYFFLDKNQFYLDKTCFFLISETPRFLTAIFSSKFFEFAYKNIYSSIELGVSGFQYNKHALIKLPVPKLSEAEQQPFISLVNQILAGKEQKQDTTALERQIDALVYELYELTAEEIKTIENA